MTAPMPDTAADVVADRSGGMCEVCGLSGWHQLHHRRPRGMGGTSRDDVHSPANLLAVCQPCHAKIESHRSWAYANGYLLTQSQDPAEVTVRLAAFNDVKCRLMPNGMVQCG